jgi:hypothetical protein
MELYPQLIPRIDKVVKPLKAYIRRHSHGEKRRIDKVVKPLKAYIRRHSHSSTFFTLS